MKKFFIQSLLLLSFLPAISQGTIFIQGTITDSVTGNAIAGHVVKITADSTSTFFYNKTIHTNLNGYYRDTISFNSAVVNYIYVSTWDCNMVMHQQTITIEPSVIFYYQDFQLCTTPNPCFVNFTHYQSQVFTVGFNDLSTGGGNSRYWNFGDGTNTTLNNPVHTYSAEGYYTVSLTIGDSLSSCFEKKAETIFVNGGGQFYVSITGTVKNSYTGDPMANYAVTWGFGDTLSGPRTVYTNTLGLYADSVLLAPGITSGNYYVWSRDCHYTQLIGGSYSMSNYRLKQNFNANCETNPPCVAKIKVTPAGPLSVQFEDNSKGGVTSRMWNFGDGTTSTDLSPLHTYSTQGDFVVSLRISNSITGCSDSAYKLIHFGDSLLCNASFSYSHTMQPKAIEFQNLSSSSNDLHHWYFSDSESSSLENPTHNFRFPGLYLVILDIGDYTKSCWTSTTQPVLISDPVIPCQSQFTYTINPAIGKKIVQFTDQSTGLPDSWHWNFGDGDSSNLRYPIHTFSAPGIYHVCLTISGFECENSFCMDVSITDSVTYHQVYGQIFAGYFPVTSGQVLISSIDTTGSFTPFMDIAPIDSNGVYYFTLVPGGNYVIEAIPGSSSGYLPTYFGNVLNWQQASVVVLGTANNPYNINLVPADLMKSGPGSASGQIIIHGLKASFVDKINMLIRNSGGIPIGFSMVSSTGDFDFTSLDYGTYYLYPELPGIKSDQIMINLSAQKPHEDVVMTFTGNKILGVEAAINMVNKFLVYPNPFSEKLIISIDMKQIVRAEVEIYNLSGQKVSGKNVLLNRGENTIEISSSSIPSGVYTLCLKSNDGLNFHVKLVKTR